MHRVSTLPGLRSLAAVFAAVTVILALVPTGNAASNGSPPLPPLIGEGVLAISCASETVAAEPVCQQWRRDYAAWELRRKARLSVEAGRDETENACLDPNKAQSSECQRWLNELVTWYKRQVARHEIARLEAEVIRIGERPGDQGFYLSEDCSGATSGGGWGPLGKGAQTSCEEYNQAKRRLEDARAAFVARWEEPLPARVTADVSPPPEMAGDTCDELAFAETPACQRWFKDVAAWRERQADASAGATAVASFDAPPGGVANLVGRLCLDPELLGTEQCQDWARELETWEARARAKREMARLEAEVRRIGNQPASYFATLAETCDSVSGYFRCPEYERAVARLEAARAELAAATEEAVDARGALVAEAESFLVIANARNRFFAGETELKARVRSLYLKEEESWPNAVASRPFARPFDNPAHRALLRAVLGMSDEELETHWRRVAASGDIRPPQVTSVRDLFQQIARHEGAFGIVAEAEAKELPALIRVLFRFSPAE